MIGNGNAIDGNVGTKMQVSTGEWIIDLQTPHTIHRTKIDWNSCQCATPGAVVLSSSLDGVHWIEYAQPTVNSWRRRSHTITSTEASAVGRFFKVKTTPLAANRELQMWSFDLFGHIGARVNLARGMGAMVAQSPPSSAAVLAVDGNVASCIPSDAGTYTNPWWRLDLGVATPVQHVKLWTNVGT